MIDPQMWRLFTEAKRTRRVSKIVRRRGGAGGLSNSGAEEEEEEKEEAGERSRERGGYDTGVASGRKRRVKVSCNYPEASYV